MLTALSFHAPLFNRPWQVVVPKTYTDYTSRRVLTSEWLEGEKLSQSKADDVGTLVNIGVICYLKQLLEFGFFHSDPHPGWFRDGLVGRRIDSGACSCCLLRGWRQGRCALMCFRETTKHMPSCPDWH